MHSWGLLRQRTKRRGGCGREQKGIIDSSVNGVELKREGEVTCGCEEEEEEEDEGFLRNHQPKYPKGRRNREE